MLDQKVNKDVHFINHDEILACLHPSRFIELFKALTLKNKQTDNVSENIIVGYVS